MGLRHPVENCWLLGFIENSAFNLRIPALLPSCKSCGTTSHCNPLQHATIHHLKHTHCNARTATHCNTLQHTATHCNTLQHATIHHLKHAHWNARTATHCNTLQHTVTHCNTLQHTATHCNTLQYTTCNIHTATHGLQHTATHCILSGFIWNSALNLRLHTLQHTATHCKTLQDATINYLQNTHNNARTAPHCNTLHPVGFHLKLCSQPQITHSTSYLEVESKTDSTKNATPPNPKTQIPWYKYKLIQHFNLSLCSEIPRNLSSSIWWILSV